VGNLSPQVQEVFVVTRLDRFLNLQWAGQQTEPAAQDGHSPSPTGFLVVGDAAAVLCVLAARLRLEGFQVWLAGHGQQAIELYQQHREELAVVLLDVLLPGMDGPHTLTALQKLGPTVRCCFMTGNPTPYTEEALLVKTIEDRVEGHAPPAFAPLLGVAATRVIHKDLTHGVGRGCEEIAPVRRALEDPGAVEAQIGFVDQGSGRKALRLVLLVQEAGGDAAQLVVNQSGELIFGLDLAFLHGQEQPRHFALLHLGRHRFVSALKRTKGFGRGLRMSKVADPSGRVKEKRVKEKGKSAMRASRPAFFRVGLVLVLAAALAAPTQATADFMLVTKQSDLGANDSVDWGGLGSLTTPNFKISSAGGTQVNGQISGFTGEFQFFSFGLTQLNGSAAISGFDGSFLQLLTGVQITLTFTEPVFGFGAEIVAATNGAFASSVLVAKDTKGNSQTISLGLSFSGFAGVRSDTANLASLTFADSGGSFTSGSHTELTIGQPALLHSPTASAVPEPGGFTLAGMGILGLLGFAWRQRRQVGA
jgi:CheY-like chemotaxis protein